MNHDIPIPPGAEDDQGRPIQADVIDTPKVDKIEDEKPVGFLAKVSSKTRGFVRGFGRVLGTAAGWAANKMAWAYDRTLNPVLNLVEAYVPGAGQLRKAAFWYGVTIVVIGFVLGGVILAEQGAGLAGIVLGMLVGAVLLPALVITTPAIWLSVAVDLWMLSAIYNFIDTAVDWIDGTTGGYGFWSLLTVRMFPGWTILYTNRRREREAATALAAV